MIRIIKMSISVFLCASLIMGISLVSRVAEKKVGAATYKLVWSDEFNGDSLNLSDWNIEVNGKGGGNEEHQYYTDSEKNIKVSDGTLKINGIKESYNGKSYTSGRINTMDKHSFLYGKIEARMKLPRFQGAWPAFWMLGSNYKKAGWPRCGEIDIMEAINDNNEIHANLHWQNKNMQGDISGVPYKINDRTQWHVYGFVWTEEYMKFYVDGKVFQSYKIDNEKDMEEFRKDHFIILNLAIGGKWPGHSIDNTAFPDHSTVEVDYVRAYERTDNPTTYVGPTKLVNQDAVAEHNTNWEAYFDKEQLGQEGTVTTLGTPSNGFVADIPTIGTPAKESAWFASALLKDLKVYNGATYKLDCTITSDKNKRIMIRVVDADKLEYISEYITLEAGVPYEFTSYVNILNDFESSLDIQYGFAKINGEAAANNSSVCITVENISFTTTTYIPDPPETVITTQNTKQKTKPISEIAKPSKVIVKKVYKKKLSAKKIKLVLKKAKNANKYEVAVYKTKKNANKSRQALIKKEFYNTKITIKSNKLKNKPKLYLRARGINAIESNKKYGKWSKVKLLKSKKG